jgi:hypothetical protein
VGRFESRAHIQRFALPSSRNGEPTHQPLRLLQHLREFSQPPRALGG